jgi:uncharacterized membrane protein
METWLKTIFEYLYITIGTFGVAIIVWCVILSVYKLLKLEFSRLKNKSIYRERESVRHQFASYLLFALEFLIAADIIATVIHPAFEEIAILASIVVIRTMISYFLEKEISKFNANSACGMPYYIGGQVESEEQLIDLDLAYAPPFLGVWDPVQIAARKIV